VSRARSTATSRARRACSAARRTAASSAVEVDGLLEEVGGAGAHGADGGGTSAWPVRKITATCGSSARSASNSVRPLASGRRTSASTTSGACAAAACRPSVAVPAVRAT
jgi:hypothetical protein